MLPKKWNRRWKVHQRTQRELGRVVFLLTAALPTLLVVCWIAWSTTPWYRNWQIADWEARLSRGTLMSAKIGSVFISTPHCFRLDDVQLVHPETGREVIRIRTIEGDRRSKVWAIRMVQPELDGDELKDCWTIIHDRFACSPKMASEWMSVSMKDVTIKSRQSGTTLNDVQIDLVPQPEQMISRIQFRIAGIPSNSLAKLVITRKHTAQALSTQVNLNTNGLALPYSLLSDYFPAAPQLGSDASFVGDLEWTLFGSEWYPRWSVDVAGDFRNIQLANLTSQMPHGLSGQAVARIDSVRIESGRLRYARGWMYSEPGRIGRELVVSAETRLGARLALPDVRTRTETELTYEGLAFNFEIDDQGIKLGGRYELSNQPDAPKAILIDQGHVVLFEPVQGLIPAQTFAAWLDTPIGNPNEMFGSETSGRRNETGIAALSWLPLPNRLMRPATRLRPTASSQQANAQYRR